MQKTKNKRPLHRSERYRILGYERDKAAMLQAARSMSAAEMENLKEVKMLTCEGYKWRFATWANA